MTARKSILAAVAASTATGLLFATPAQAATLYSCPLAGPTPCTNPLSGTLNGDVRSTSDGYSFNLSGSGAPGYVQVNNSTQINPTLPFTLSVQVKGVGVPSTAVGDYDIVRGTPGGNWKVEVVARKNRTIAQAGCYFRGDNGKGFAVGGPDLSKMTGWITIKCVDTGRTIETYVNNDLVKTLNISTGPLPVGGPMRIGAKDINGGDQFSGYAKNVSITTG